MDTEEVARELKSLDEILNIGSGFVISKLSIK